MTMKEMVLTYADDHHNHQHCGMAKMQRQMRQGEWRCYYEDESAVMVVTTMLLTTTKSMLIDSKHG